VHRKTILEAFTLVSAQPLTASFQSKPTTIKYMDRAYLLISCTGTPTGTVTVQASPDGVTWADMPLGLNGLAGSAQNYHVDIQQTAAALIRINYNFSSGSGFMTATVTAKE
jgi:hypothetical protein